MTNVVSILDEAVDNIHRYQSEVRDDPKLASLMKRVHAWYAVKSDDGSWVFAPSKFVGYVNNNAQAYFAESGNRDGRSTEAALRSWFTAVPPDTRLDQELKDALRKFLKEIRGTSDPRRNMRICILKEVLKGDADTLATEVLDRIRINAGICGGRPHIRGTRVRVSDILDLLANDVPQSQILADYPYLKREDLRAALTFGAAASQHRIIAIS